MSKKALLSVYDKTGIIDLANGLMESGFQLITSGGTASVLKESGIPVDPVETITGSPEMLGGRVKTLHPFIHGGILYRKEEDQGDVREYGLPGIDLVAVNLYPFKEVVREEHTLQEAIEKIDIGGVALIRAAAKNHERVTVAVSPSDYPDILRELKEHGEVTDETRKRLAVQGFQHTADYDTSIYHYFQNRYLGELFTSKYHIIGEKMQDLRYGENPNQRAAFYRTEHTSESSILKAKKLHGKELSYNNILDMDAALDMVKDFREPTVVGVKHNNPCGIASGEDLREAYMKAYECDPVSIFGGVVAANRPIPEDMAQEMNKIFLEGVIAPGYLDGAREILMNKKNIRIMELKDWNPEPQGVSFAKVAEGLLVQERNFKTLNMDEVEVKSEREPTDEEKRAMEFAWKVVKHVKSNAIVFARSDRSVGIGAGQTSRVDSVKIAHMKSRSDTKGCAMASDAFFPFRDGVDAAAEAGITAIIQPGGSIRDQEVIDAVNEYGMSMVFTGYRVFRH